MQLAASPCLSLCAHVQLSEGERPGDEARIQVQCWGLYVALKSLVNLCNVIVLVTFYLFIVVLLC